MIVCTQCDRSMSSSASHFCVKKECLLPMISASKKVVSSGNSYEKKNHLKNTNNKILKSYCSQVWNGQVPSNHCIDRINIFNFNRHFIPLIIPTYTPITGLKSGKLGTGINYSELLVFFAKNSSDRSFRERVKANILTPFFQIICEIKIWSVNWHVHKKFNILLM